MTVEGVGVHSDLFCGPVDDARRYAVAADDVPLAEVGGEGIVYRAREVSTGRRVALKLLTVTPATDVDRLAERSAALVGLHHPNLMEQIEVFLGAALDADPDAAAAEEFDVPYSVSGWIDGRPLAVAAEAAAVGAKLLWIGDLAAAVACLHTSSAAGGAGIVHRDIKPSNVRVRPDGSAVLLDFGAARPPDPTDMTERVGTYLWRAPEVLAGTVVPGAPADAWGVGAVAHWLFVGEPPHLDGADAARERIAATPDCRSMPAGEEIARHLAQLLDSAPDRRPADLIRWRDDLLRLARRRRSRAHVAGMLIGAVASVAVLSVVTASGPPAGPEQRPDGLGRSVGRSALISVSLGAENARAFRALSDAEAAGSPIVPTTGGRPAAVDPARVVLRCDNGGAARMDAVPGVMKTPRQRTVLTLPGRTENISCTSTVDPSKTGAWLEALSLEFPELDCYGGPTTPPAGGIAKIGWADGTTSVGVATATLYDTLRGTLETVVEEGPFTGDTIRADFTALPAGGNCDLSSDGTPFPIEAFSIQLSEVFVIAPLADR